MKEIFTPPNWNLTRIKGKGMGYAYRFSDKGLMTDTGDPGRREGTIGRQLHGFRDITIDYRKIGVAKL